MFSKTKIFFTKIGGKIRAFVSLAKIIAELPDGEYELTISRTKKKRTHPQNAYYWGVVLAIIANEAGYTADEVHKLFKKEFLTKKKRLGKLGRKVIFEEKSTTELSTVEFEEYLAKIRNFAYKFGYNIPLPNEITEDVENIF